MNKNIITKAIAGATKFAADKSLKSSANSTSCIVLYQPTAPKSLEKFKKNSK